MSLDWARFLRDRCQSNEVLRNDYVFAGIRQAAEEARARGIKRFYIVHGDKR